MTTSTSKIGLGGGCHWCTEGIFASLCGVTQVKQGWIASIDEHAEFSEAIEVYFDPSDISLDDLIEIHLYTHSSTSNHSMRGKYRSGIYVYDDVQAKQALNILNVLKLDFDQALVTQVYTFNRFKQNKIALQDYYYSDPDKPFCQTYIQPKLKLLLARFMRHVDKQKMAKIGLL